MYVTVWCGLKMNDWDDEDIGEEKSVLLFCHSINDTLIPIPTKPEITGGELEDRAHTTSCMWMLISFHCCLLTPVISVE